MAPPLGISQSAYERCLRLFARNVRRCVMDVLEDEHLYAQFCRDLSVLMHRLGMELHGTVERQCPPTPRYCNQ